MIVNDRIVTYIHSLEKQNTSLLEEIEKFAIDTDVPIIRKEMESFLRVMIMLIQPKRILEVGTAIGYSALIMNECMPKDCTITTIENYEKRIATAKDNFLKAEAADKITLLEGDAMSILPELHEKYDLIFMDAAKGQYINFLPEIIRLLSDRGAVISDNILQEGDIIESRYGITRRNRTIHSRMREYLYTLKNHEILETTIVPIGDGITISVRKDLKNETSRIIDTSKQFRST